MKGLYHNTSSHNKFQSQTHVLCLWALFFLVLTYTLPTTALVSTMVNATTSEIQEQWLILHAPAAYGPSTQTAITSAPMLPTDPYLCTNEAKDDFTGRHVLIKRGNCPFFDKTLNAQMGNATGIIVNNGSDDDPLITMSYDDKVNTTKITIPSVMVRESPWDYLKNMTQHAQPTPPTPPPVQKLKSRHIPKDISLLSNSNDDEGYSETDENDTQNTNMSTMTFPSHVSTKSTPFRIFSSELQHLSHKHPLHDLAFHPLLNIGSIFDDINPSSSSSTSPIAHVTKFHAMQLQNEQDVLAFVKSQSIVKPSHHRKDTIEERQQSLKHAHIIQNNTNNNNNRNAFASFAAYSTLQIPNKPIPSPSTTPLSTTADDLKVDPFDPDLNPDPFYFYLTIDERGESIAPRFPFQQLQIILFSLMILPLLWVLFLVGRCLRLYWGFRCVEELVTNTATNLPICRYIQTNDYGEIIFDSGDGTAANNALDSNEYRPDYVKSSLTASNDPRAHVTPLLFDQNGNSVNTHTNTTGNTYGATASLDDEKNNEESVSRHAESTLFSQFSSKFTSSTNKRQPRPIIIAPSHALYLQLQNSPTVSSSYISTSLTSPTFTPVQQSSLSSALTFSSRITNTNGNNTVNDDPIDMTYYDVNTQMFTGTHHHSHNPNKPQQHLRVHNDTCNICLEPFVTCDEVKILGCMHAFHPACIDQYFHSSSSSSSAETLGTAGNPMTDLRGIEQLEARHRTEQRRMYALAYIQSSYDFDELTTPPAAPPQPPQTSQTQPNGINTSQPPFGTSPATTTNTTNNVQQLTAGQSCPTCRRSILQTARYTTMIKKKWWIHLFEWICLCSCCCPTYRRQRRQRHRIEEANQTPIIIDYSTGDAEFLNTSSSIPSTRTSTLYDPTSYQYNTTSNATHHTSGAAFVNNATLSPNDTVYHPPQFDALNPSAQSAQPTQHLVLNQQQQQDQQQQQQQDQQQRQPSAPHQQEFQPGYDSNHYGY